MFGKNFERATRIFDQGGVKKISGEPSGRSIFQVIFLLSLSLSLPICFRWSWLGQDIYQVIRHCWLLMVFPSSWAILMFHLVRENAIIIKHIWNMNSVIILFLQVVGESRKKEEYLCFPEHFCSCYSFFYDVVNRGEELCVSFTSHLLLFSVTPLYIITFIDCVEVACQLLNLQCKHQLAARLAASTATCIDVKVSDEELALLLSKLWYPQENAQL